MLRKFLTVLVVSACLTLLAGPVLAGEIIVSGAASLTESFTELKKNFEAANPGIKVTTNFAASGVLLKQMSEGAPVDVFASADQKTMDQAVQAKLIDLDSRKNFVANSLVLVQPADSKIALTKLEDLSKPEVTRLAIGNPDTVPVGRYSEQSLKKAGLWDALQAKIVRGENVKQVLDYAARGEVEAALVFGTDAKAAKAKVKSVLTLSGHDPITYPIAVVAASQNKADAAKFEQYVLSPAGQEVLGAYGFSKP